MREVSVHRHSPLSFFCSPISTTNPNNLYARMECRKKPVGTNRIYRLFCIVDSSSSSTAKLVDRRLVITCRKLADCLVAPQLLEAPIRCILRINKSRARIKVLILMMDQIRFLNDDVLRNSMKYSRYLSFLHRVK